MNWLILTYLDAWDLTRQALLDALAQTVPNLMVLVVDNGSRDDYPEMAQLQLAHPNLLRWRYQPGLLSLSAVWNRALQMVWDSGGEQALVMNNDVRVWEGTYEYLQCMQQTTDSLFVSATGVTLEQYETWQAAGMGPVGQPPYPLPGPDFSCYLITKACHQKYPFDEGFMPAYTEDCSLHRTLMLAGDGGRIFGTGLPFAHLGSGTLKAMSPERRIAWEQRITHGSRAHYFRLWGGPANAEKFIQPFGPEAYLGVTNPELFERVRNGQRALPDVLVRDAAYSATPDSPAGC